MEFSAARGFLMKHEATDKLVSAVRKLLGGGVYLSRALEERMFQTFVGGQVVEVRGATGELPRAQDASVVSRY